MLDQLNAKKIYQKSFFKVLGDKNAKLHEEILDESYDIIIIMGGFAQSHLPVNTLYQAARALKSGIYLFFFFFCGKNFVKWCLIDF